MKADIHICPGHGAFGMELSHIPSKGDMRACGIRSATDIRPCAGWGISVRVMLDRRTASIVHAQRLLSLRLE